MATRRWITACFAALALLVASSTAQAALVEIIFENTQGGTGADIGDIVYDSTTGEITGVEIEFDQFSVTGTPGADGVYDCDDCVLFFSTDSVTVVNPTLWSFGAGGEFFLTGSVPDAGIVNETLLAGSFNNGAVVFSGVEASFQLTGAGVDTKNRTLLEFLGIDDFSPWTFSNTEITSVCNDIDSTGTSSFNCDVSEADLINRKDVDFDIVPEPGSMLLLGTGLLGLAGAARRRMARK